MSYFEQPLLKQPHWDRKVTAYLFVGGVMGGTGVLSLLADLSGDKALARTTRALSFGLALVCPPLLVSHLGRPERFLHMLRIVKFKSPMSLGVWGLVAFSGVSGLNVLGVRGRTVCALQALLGAFVMGYTGVLLSATAVPLWGKGKYHIPALSVCSALSGACALNAIALSFDKQGAPAQRKLEKLEAAASLAELALLQAFRSYAGATGDPMFRGARGRSLRTWTAGAGIAAPLLLNLQRPSFARTVLAGGLALLGGYVLRETLIEAGKASAADPSQALG